jgi:hypothetical protein
MSAQAFLELPLGETLDAIHCPACGAKVLSTDGEEQCLHLAYIYLDELGEFTDVAPHFKDALDAILEDEEADDHPVNTAATVLNSSSLLHLAVTTSGTACGPVCSTVYVGIDFAPSDAPQAPTRPLLSLV